MSQNNLLLFNLVKLNSILLFFLPISLLIGTLISEIIINLIVINFLVNSIIKKNWQWTKTKEFKILVIFWFYLIINFILAASPILSATRSIFFIRFVIFVFAVVEIFKDKKFEKIIFSFWMVIILTISFDIYIEFIYGKNLIGNSSDYPGRISSFLGKELKIGHFVYSLFLPIFSFFLLSLNNKINKDKNYFSTIIFIGIIFCMSSIILTGERSNSIKAIFCFFLFFILMKNFVIQRRILFIISLIIFLTFLLFNKERLRIYTDYTKLHNNNFNYTEYLKESLHGAHYITAWKIFKNYPYFGIGNKNFRIECNKEIYLDNNYKHSEYRCATHPHQIYLELLSELGIVGFLIILYFIINILIKSFINYFKNYNPILMSCALFVFSTFMPLIPSGSFFTSFGAGLFWLNVGILMSNIDKK